MSLYFASSLAVTAQFSIAYYNDHHSLMGYDIVKLNDKYYYTSGNENYKLLFEIDPTNGTIVNPSTNIKEFQTTGSRNTTGKNSTALCKFAIDPPMVQPGMMITGVRDYVVNTAPLTTYPEINYYYIEDLGGTLSEYGGEEFIPPPSPGGSSSEPWVSYVSSYADQMTMDIQNDGIDDFRYFTGSALGETFGGDPYNPLRVPYLLRHHRIFGSPFPQSNYMRVLHPVGPVANPIGNPGAIPEYPTRVIPNEVTHEAYVTYGSALHDANNDYFYSDTKRDAGVWAVGENFWNQFSLTYSTGDIDQNLGVAQSIVIAEPNYEDDRRFLTFIACGDHPNTSINPHGLWDNDYFHLVKINSTDGKVEKAKKFKLSDSYPDFTVSYSHVNGSDVLYTEDGPGIGTYVVAGSTKKTYNGAVGPITHEKVFVSILDQDMNVLLSADFNASDINATEIRELRVNRVKLIDDDYWIVGSFASVNDLSIRIPFLLRVTKDLESGCYDPHIMSGEIVEITEKDRPNTLHNYSVAQSPEDLPNAGLSDLSDRKFCDGSIGQNQDFISPGPKDEKTGIEPRTEISIGLLPNPAQTQITIKGLNSEETEITVIDILGKEVMRAHYSNPKEQPLDISTLENGTYLMLIRQGAVEETIRFIKE